MKEKLCRVCEIPRSLEDFRLLRILEGNPIHNGTCNFCLKEQVRKAGRRRNQKFKLLGISRYQNLSPKTKRNGVLRRYGLTVEDYDKMLLEQNRVCYMCKQPNKAKYALHVDHNHETGKVRHLLCHRCNNGLRFVEDEVFLTKALSYLAEFQKESILN